MNLAHPIAAALALLAVGCTTHRGAPLSPDGGTTTSASFEWPERQHPSSGWVKKGSDFTPVDFGVFANCRIYGHPGIVPGDQTTMAIASQSAKIGHLKNFSSNVSLGFDDRSGSLRLQNQRATFAMAFVASPGTRTRGNVAFLTSLNTLSSQEQSLIDHLNGRGWNVLAVTSSTDLLTVAELESTEEGKLELTQFSKPGVLAGLIDDHIAERAYATAAALGFLKKHNPAWQQPCLAVLGASLGGLAVPATTARLAPDVDAAVLIAAGARIPNIFTETSLDLFDPANLVVAPPEPGSEDPTLITRPFTEAETRELADAATALSKLDPETTAAALHNIPTLLLHARSDQIVPARYGRQLAELLPDAERWSYPFGHTTLFLSLPFRAARIARWLENNIPNPTVPSRPGVVN